MRVLDCDKILRMSSLVVETDRNQLFDKSLGMLCNMEMKYIREVDNILTMLTHNTATK